MKFNCKITLAFFMIITSLLLDAKETQGFLTRDDITLFYKQGYLLKAQALSQEEVKKLDDNIKAVIDRALEEIQHSKDLTFSEDDQIIYIDGSRVVYKRHLDQSVSIARINGCGGMQPAFLATMRSEKMLYTFFELLGTNDLEHLISQIHPKIPGDRIAYPKHRDIQFRKSFDPGWNDILGNGSYAICIIAVESMTPENGGLWIDRNNYPESQGLEEDRVWLCAQPGDLIFIHPYLYHGSGPNLSPNSSRKTLLTGFCAFGANHKQYPGAYVNTRFKLTEKGQILISDTSWSQDQSLGSAVER